MGGQSGCLTSCAAQLLVHASLHSLVQKTAQARQHISNLPLLGRILLQTGPKAGPKYQIAVASALAHKLQVHPGLGHLCCQPQAADGRTVPCPAVLPALWASPRG